MGHFIENFFASSKITIFAKLILSELYIQWIR